MRQIDVTGVRGTWIFGIDPEGDIIGSDVDATGRRHGFLLRGRNES